MYNLLEYNSNYSDITFFSDNEAADFNGHIVNTNNFKSFSCKVKAFGNT